jgi:hypothetical protein
LLRRGSEDIGQLDEDELMRFGVFMFGVLTELDNAYYCYRAGLLEEGRWQQVRGQLKGTLQPPGAIRWWESNQMGGVLSPEFVALVDEILGEEAPAERED